MKLSEYHFNLKTLLNCPVSMAESGKVRIVGREFRRQGDRVDGARYCLVEHVEGRDVGISFWASETELKDWNK